MQLAVLHLLRDVLRSPVDDLDHAVDHALQELARKIGAGRACLVRLLNREVLPPQGEPWCNAATLIPTHIGDLDNRQVVSIAGAILVPVHYNQTLAAVMAFTFENAAPIAIDERQAETLLAAAEAIETALTRRAEDIANRDTARRLEATLNALPDLLFEITSDGRFAEFIAGPESLMVLPSHDLRGQRMDTVLPPHVAKIALAALRDALRDGRVTGVQYRLDLATGPHWFELSGTRKPALVADQPPTVIFLVRDVTQDTRIRAEVARLGHIVETMDNLVTIIDHDHCIVWANPAHERLTGWSLAELRGKPLAGLPGWPKDDSATCQGIENALKTHTACHGQTRRFDRDGVTHWVDYSLQPLQDPDGGMAWFVLIETVVDRLKEQETLMANLAQSATAAHERLVNAVRAMPDGVVILDDQDRVIIANAAYQNMFPELAAIAQPGVPLAQVLEHGLRKGIIATPPKDDADCAAYISKRMATYRLPRDIDEIELPDGRWIRRMHMRTSDGGCVAIIIDTTARRNQIAALDTANAELSAALDERDRAKDNLISLIDGAEVGVWELDILTDTIRVGGNWAEMLGRGRRQETEFVYSDLFDLIHPDDTDNLPDPRCKPIPETKNGFIEFVFRIRHDEGNWVWILARCRISARDENGMPTAMAGVHIDITENKRLEQEISTQQAFLAEVMETSVTALVVLDQSGRFTYANHEASRLLALPREDLVGRSHDDPRWGLTDVDGRALAAQETPFARALVAPVRDVRIAVQVGGTGRRILSVNAAPLPHQDGKTRVVMSLSDITEELAATARLTEARERAEEMSRAKSIFLANMSHEIRTPLNGVLGMAEVLDSLITAPDQRHMISTIRKSGETLLTVLNSILDMSKIEAGKMELEQVPFQFSEIVAQVEALYTVQAEEKAIAFQVLVSTGADRPRLGDPHRIQQILNNLLSNALKFTLAGKVGLKISCRAGKPVVIEVEDSGVGMTPAQVDRVFESFEQADGSMTRRFGGTGLGLSIVRQLVQLMGGEISLNSTQGQGTHVRVTLPLAEVQAPMNPVVAPIAPDDTALQGKRILIADDNLTNRLVMAEMLANSGLELTLVENGLDALAAWHQAAGHDRAYDLILLDITMPEMDGMATLAHIRQAEKQLGLPMTAAVAVTANAMPHQVADFIEGGFDTHLAKPFKRAELFRAVRTLLRE